MESLPVLTLSGIIIDPFAELAMLLVIAAAAGVIASAPASSPV